MTRGTSLDDPTPLDGARVDVPTRVGWVLRMARHSAAAAPTRLEQVADALGTNITRLHRLETGQLRSGRLIDGYERVFGLPTGSLRAPIDIWCRTFPYGPGDRDPGERATSVREVSSLTRAVQAEGRTGADWLAWARAMAQPGAVGMREELAAELIGTLVTELNRSVGDAYPTRYEALSLLRCSAYGYLVVDAAEELIADPHVQVLYDVLSAVGESPDDGVLKFCLELLRDPRDRVVVGAVLALQNLAEVTAGQPIWDAYLPELVELYDDSPSGSVRWRMLSGLLRLAPKQAFRDAGVRPHQRLAPAADVTDWSRTRLNRHWAECERRAREVGAAAGVGDQPMLTRMLFDIAVAPQQSRAFTSCLLLGALPAIRVPLAAQVADIAEHHPDPVIRRRARSRTVVAVHGDHPAYAERWLTSEVPEEREIALFLAGGGGGRVPEEVREQALRDGLDRPLLYALGMTSDPELGEIAEDPTRGDDLRGAAGWWLRNGGRITDGG